MSQGKEPAGFLAAFGARLIDRGYNIIPIRRGDKRPRGDDWATYVSTPKQLAKWLSGSAARDGLGITTRDTPAVDLDILDQSIVDELIDYIRENIGDAPVRIGRAPKSLLMFRTDEPFVKVTSSSYVDPENPTKEDGKPLRQRVEILGDGQQFVAFHIHPETKKPYRWLDGRGPHREAAADLPTITREQAQAVAREYERIAEERGWRLFQAHRERPAGSSGRRDLQDPFADVAQIVSDVSDDELHRKLLLVPNADDYETWANVGMALYHQYEGEDLGLKLWHEWSSQADNYDAAALDEKWPTFDIDGKGRAPLTARYILRLAKEAEHKIRVETFGEIKDKLARVRSEEEFRDVCEEIKHIEFDKIARAQLVSLVKDKFKAITGAALAVSEARDLVRYENPTREEAPWWIDGWVYCQLDETFFHLRTRQTLSHTAFNNTHTRFLLTKKDVLEGRSTPEQSPAAVALNLAQIPVVHSRMYLPGEDDLYTLNSVDYANSYDDRNVPEVPDKLTPKGRRAIERVKAHFEHLFENERDRLIFLDWLAWVVQNPGKHVNWAVLVQGTEGDGKTFFFELLAAVLAKENVKPLVAKALEEKNTAWAEGSQVVFVEEIRLAGHNRHDVLNAVKPNITNKMVSVRRMNVDWYPVINVTNYLLTTNFRDALPLNDNDRRYFILFSRWQLKAALDAFERKNPRYYTDLFASLEEAGSLRKWLLEYEISGAFNPYGKAPDSQAKREMISYSKSDEAEALEEILAESPRIDMTGTLLNASDLPDEMAGLGAEAPYGRALSRLLLDFGFTALGGQTRIGETRARYWSRKPGKFMTNGKVDPLKIKNWLKDPL